MGKFSGGPELGDVVGFLVEISRWVPTQQSRRAGGWKMKWKGTRGMILGFPWEFSVGPKSGKVEGCVVGNEIGIGGWLVLLRV